MALPYDRRPADRTPIHTADLPPTPTRDRNIKASAWIEAPRALLELGADLAGRPEADFKRRIGCWLLWRAGPAKGDARYWAGHDADPETAYTFRIRPEGGEGDGPTGPAASFRAWKQDLGATEPGA